VHPKYKKVTVFGGGTGSYAVLSALKKMEVDLDVAAIVTMLDDGGSTGRLRDQLGVLPPGDLRQCLVALSDAPIIWRKLFTYRFDNGDLNGHNFGNIFLIALEKIASNYDEVLKVAHKIMRCSGRVIPSTIKQSSLVVTYATGRVVKGEKYLDEHNPDKANIISAHAEPAIDANPKALSRLRETDLVIVSPGDLYSSIISIALSDNFRREFAKIRAKVVFIVNLMTKSSQTYGYGAWDHVRDFEKYFGRMPDICIINNSSLPTNMVERYQKFDESPVVNNLVEMGYTGEIIEADLLDNESYVSSAPDVFASTYSHSIVRHDSDKLKSTLLSIIAPR
jgi:uncharacterized cofD-like protein